MSFEDPRAYGRESTRIRRNKGGTSVRMDGRDLQQSSWIRLVRRDKMDVVNSSGFVDKLYCRGVLWAAAAGLLAGAENLVVFRLLDDCLMDSVRCL